MLANADRPPRNRCSRDRSRDVDGPHWAAAEILGLELGGGDLLIIAVAALVVAMNPLGRIGFREAAVSVLAGVR